MNVNESVSYTVEYSFYYPFYFDIVDIVLGFGYLQKYMRA